MKKILEVAFDVAPYRLFVGGGTLISTLLAILVVAVSNPAPREGTAAAIAVLVVCIYISSSILVSGLLAAHREYGRWWYTERMNEAPSFDAIPPVGDTTGDGGPETELPVRLGPGESEQKGKHL